MFRSLRNDSGQLRGLSGSGEPGLHTLLGGTGAELDASGVSMGSGGGAATGYAKLARAHVDVRLRGGVGATVGGAAATSDGRFGPARPRRPRPGAHD